MADNWNTLTELTGNKPFTITEIKLNKKDITIKGDFDLPPFAQLTMEDQIFAGAFIKTHGSIKQMEKIFGVSYPTIKNRLNKISEKLDFLNINVEKETDLTSLLNRLANGDITVDDVLKEV